jgi:hypothetical protein
MTRRAVLGIRVPQNPLLRKLVRKRQAIEDFERKTYYDLQNRERLVVGEDLVIFPSAARLQGKMWIYFGLCSKLASTGP